MRKFFSTISLLVVANIAPGVANASLVNTSTLNFTPIASGGSFSSLPVDGLGSWFSMEVSPGVFTITPITSLNGLVLGTTQLASSAPPVGNIDDPWSFFGDMGASQTVSDANILFAAGDTATIDFSGWSVTWNANDIDMSNDAWNGNAEGVADISCFSGSGCDDGASYTLDYSATAPGSDPSSYGGVRYALHLEGTISTVPVPAAIWLFGSGLLGLASFVHRKKKQG